MTFLVQGWPIVLIAGVAGGLGALLRYGLQKLWPAHGYRIPIGVLIANVLGSFIAGFAAYLAVGGGTYLMIDIVVVIGFCGGLTTFSTFAVETVELSQAGTGRAAILNVVANVVLGLVASIGGMLLATVFA